MALFFFFLSCERWWWQKMWPKISFDTESHNSQQPPIPSSTRHTTTQLPLLPPHGGAKHNYDPYIHVYMGYQDHTALVVGFCYGINCQHVSNTTLQPHPQNNSTQPTQTNKQTNKQTNMWEKQTNYHHMQRKERDRGQITNNNNKTSPWDHVVVQQQDVCIISIFWYMSLVIYMMKRWASCVCVCVYNCFFDVYVFEKKFIFVHQK